MTDYEDILYERNGAVARISHNRPQLRNAQNTRLLEEMGAAVQRAVQDTDVRVIVIAGTGDHFSAGHDLKDGESRRHFTVEERFAHAAPSELTTGDAGAYQESQGLPS